MSIEGLGYHLELDEGDIPIDPDLLALDINDDSSSTQESADEVQSQSSGLDDDVASVFAPDDEEEELVEVDQPKPPEDAVFM
jgi:hypothetical protein